MERKCQCCCPVETALDLIGGKYKPLILWHLADGTLRFGQLQRLMPKATPKTLTNQLRELETAGLLTRIVYPEVPPKVEYALTPLGRSLYPILSSLCRWGTDYLHSQDLEPNCSMVTPKRAQTETA